MKGLFLDLDGVINCDKIRGLGITLEGTLLEDTYRPELVENINTLCKTLGLSIIVTSSWKNFYSNDEMIKIFKTIGLTAPVIGFTQNHGLGVIARSAEISEWLNDDNNPKIEQYLIIDDAAEVGIGHEEFFIKTSTDKGFTPILLLHAIDRYMFHRDFTCVDLFEQMRARQMNIDYYSYKSACDDRELTYNYRYIPRSDCARHWETWSEAWISAKQN